MTRAARHARFTIVLLLIVALMGCSNLLGGGSDGGSGDGTNQETDDDGTGGENDDDTQNQSDGGTALLSIENNESVDIELFPGSYSLGSPGSSEAIQEGTAVASGQVEADVSFPADRTFNMWYTYTDPSDSSATVYVRLVQSVNGKLSVFDLEADAEYTLELGLPNDTYSFYRTDTGGQVAAPAIAPDPGSYDGPTAVAIDSATQGATIYYTLDGTTPTISSTQYTDPFIISSDTTVKAFATADGLTDSDVVTASYAIQSQDTSSDTERPTVETFTGPSDVTQSTVWFHELTGSDNTGIVAWQITEGYDRPSAGDPNWKAFKPDSHELSSTGYTTLYAWAKDGAGNVSFGESHEVTYEIDDTPPSPVTNLEIASSTETTATLMWTDPPDKDLADILVTYSPNGSDPVAVTPGVEEKQFTDLDPDTDYTFSVTTVDGNGNESGTATATLSRALLEFVKNYTVEDGLAAGSDSRIDNVSVDGDTIIVGYSYNNHAVPISVSTDGGDNWTHYTTDDGLPTNDAPADVYVRGNSYYVAWDNSNNDYGLAVSKDGGTSWETHTDIDPNPYQEKLRSVYVDSEGSIYVGMFSSYADEGGVAILDASESSWSNYHTSNSDLVSNRVSEVIVDSGTLYVATQGGLSVTSDPNSAWTNYTTELPDSDIDDVHVNGQYIVLATFNGVIWSSDGGDTWTSEDQFVNAADSVYYDGSYLYAVTNGLHVSADGGQSWQDYMPDGTWGNQPNEVVVDGTKVYVASWYSSTSYPAGLTVFEIVN